MLFKGSRESKCASTVHYLQLIFNHFCNIVLGKLLFLLLRDAIKEILRDTVRSATRAEISGSWRPPKAKVQSRLLDNALSQALQSNRRLKNHQKSKKQK